MSEADEREERIRALCEAVSKAALGMEEIARALSDLTAAMAQAQLDDGRHQ